MAYRLRNGEFRVSCKNPGCPFDFKAKITQNIQGITESDVESEAMRIARDIGRLKHDAIYGRNHTLTNPTIRKVSGVYEAIGAMKKSLINQSEAIKYKEYGKGEHILKKGDIAATICEVIKGSAYVDKNKSHVYKPGESFGASALLINQTRTADVISAEDNTTIAFYNLKELSKKDPRKAKALYTNAMEDIFDVIENLESLVCTLESTLEEEKILSENRKERIMVLEEELLSVTSELNEK